MIKKVSKSFKLTIQKKKKFSATEFQSLKIAKLKNKNQFLNRLLDLLLSVLI